MDVELGRAGIVIVRHVSLAVLAILPRIMIGSII
jgi:hypothetical protein